MRGRTKRRWGRFFPKSRSEVLVLVLAIFAILIAIVPMAGTQGLEWSAALVILLAIGLKLRAVVHAPSSTYFTPVDFEAPQAGARSGVLGVSSPIVSRAAQGLLNFEKAEPWFVHAAPRNLEVDKVLQKLEKAGFAEIYDDKGKGKSLTAFHAAYNEHIKKGVSVYKLETARLRDKSAQGLPEDFEEHLDTLPGKKKLVIVDDAHTLGSQARQALRRLMQLEAKEGAFEAIFVSTELLKEVRAPGPKGHIRLDFDRFTEKLRREFYESPNPDIVSVVQGGSAGLNDAIKAAEKGKVHDPWQFNYVASEGQKRVKGTLTRFDPAGRLIIFLIAAYNLITGDQELPITKLQEIAAKVPHAWFKQSLGQRKLIDVVKSLQEHQGESADEGASALSFIRVRYRSENDPWYIQCHPKTAAEIVNEALRANAQTASEMIESLGLLLDSEHQRLAYVSLLLRALPRDQALQFVKSNKSWFVEFISNPLPESAFGCALTLRFLKRVDKDAGVEVLGNLNPATMARNLVTFDAGHFSAAAELLSALGKDHRETLLGELDDLEGQTHMAWSVLAGQVAQAKVNDFGQLAKFLNALPDKRDELLSKVTWEDFAGRAAQAKVDDFGQVESLLTALQDKRGALLDKIADKQWKALAGRAAQAKVSDFGQVESLLNALQDKRGALLDRITDKQWKALAGQAAQTKVNDFQQVAQFLEALQGRRGALLDRIADKQWKALADQVTQAKLSELPKVAALLRMLGTRDIATEESTDDEADEDSAPIRERAAGQPGPYLPDRRGLLLQYFDVPRFAQTANACSGEELGDLTTLVAALDDERRSEVQCAVDWPSLVTRCPLKAETLLALGRCLKNVWEPVEQHAVDRSGQERNALHLDQNKQQLEEAVRAAYKAKWRHYGGAARLLRNCHHVHAPLALQIAEGAFEDAVGWFLIAPTNYRSVGRLIEAFHEISPGLAMQFLRHHTVFGRIIRSLNTHDWTKSVAEARVLVKAIMKGSPETWGRMRDHIQADLSALDIPSIHTELAEEVAAGNKEADSSPGVAGSD